MSDTPKPLELTPQAAELLAADPSLAKALDDLRDEKTTPRRRMILRAKLSEAGVLPMEEGAPTKPIAPAYPNGMPPDTLKFSGARAKSREGPAEAPEWEEPNLGEMPAAAPFPLDVFPPAVADLVAAAAEALPCPPDFLACPMLAAAGGAIGRSLLLAVKESWFETASLFLAFCAEPGSTKSEALRIATEPISDRHSQDLFDHAVERALAKESKRLGDALRRTKGEAPAGDNDDGPPLRRVKIGDTTTEKLAVILSQNPRGVTMVQDELTSWIAGMNQYKGGSGNDRQFYLSAWGGASISIDRKSQTDGVPIHVPHPFLVIAGAATPDILPLLNPGDKEDGFVDRILFSYPEKVKVRFSTAVVSPKLRRDWADVVNRLYGLPLGEDGRGHAKPSLVRLSKGALERFAAFHDGICEESEREDFPRNLRGPWSKLRGYCARIALILGGLQWAASPDSKDVPTTIDLATLNRAIKLIEYFKSHAARAHFAIQGGAGNNPDARDVLNWAVRRGKPSFSFRELRDALRKRFSSRPYDLETAVDWLVATRCIRRQITTREKAGGGYPCTPVYDLNPLLTRGGARITKSFPCKAWEGF